MASLNEFEETISSIKLHSFTSFLMLIVSVTGVTQLFSYYRNSNIQITASDKLSFLPFIIWLLCSLLFLTLNSHSSPQLNNKFFIIDNYCHIAIQLFTIIQSLSLPSLSIFVLTRIRYIFESTPWRLTRIEYQIQLLICIFVCILSVCYNSISLEATIFIANDNADYKLCHFELNEFGRNTSPPPIAWIPSLLNNIYLFYMLNKKCIQYRNMVNVDMKILENAKTLKRAMILLVFLKLVSAMVIFGLFILYKIRYLFGLQVIIDCCVLIYSLKGKLCDINDEPIELSEEENNRLLRRIEDAFHAMPERYRLDGVQSDRVPFLQIEGD